MLLLVDENFPRVQWILVSVFEVITSQDGYVRTAKVKTTSRVATCAKKHRQREVKTSSDIQAKPVSMSAGDGRLLLSLLLLLLLSLLLLLFCVKYAGLPR